MYLYSVVCLWKQYGLNVEFSKKQEFILNVSDSSEGLFAKAGQPIPIMKVYYWFYIIDTPPESIIVCWVVLLGFWDWYVISYILFGFIEVIALCS